MMYSGYDTSVAIVEDQLRSRSCIPDRRSWGITKFVNTGFQAFLRLVDHPLALGSRAYLLIGQCKWK